MRSIILVLLTFLDSLFTIIFLQLAIATEFNPIMAYVIRHYGYLGLIIVKLFVVLLFVGVMQAVERLHPRRVQLAYRIALAIHVPLTIYHLKIFYFDVPGFLASR